MFNKTAFKAIFSLANAFMSTPLIVNSFIKAYKVDKKSVCLLKIPHKGRDLEVQRLPKPRSNLDFA